MSNAGSHQPTSTYVTAGEEAGAGETPTYYTLYDVFPLGISNRGMTLTNTHTASEGSVTGAVIISAINQMIGLPEGRIASSVLLQGIGVWLLDPDLLVLVCKSI